MRFTPATAAAERTNRATSDSILIRTLALCTANVTS
jgi:hypothetical protein